MKKIVLPLLVAGVLAVGCKKEQPLQPDQAIMGRWQWLVRYGTQPGDSTTSQNTGIQETLVINQNKTWSVVRNGTLASSGTFHLSVETNNRGEKVNSIHYRSPANSTIAFYKIYNDTTLMVANYLMGAVGGGATYYVRR